MTDGGPDREWINVADALSVMARQSPDRTAVVFPSGTAEARLSFVELDRLSESFAAGFQRAGLRQGDRTLVFIPPGPELIATVFGLLKAGAVPVLMDPGLPRNDLLACIRECEAVGLVGIPLARALPCLFPRAFKTLRVAVTAGVGKFWPGPSLARMRLGSAERVPVQCAADDAAAIAFTSGSTGVPKGVVYTHGNFRAQVDIMRDVMGIAPGDVHLACVTIFALFNPALGVTTVIPQMDPKHPADVDPAGLVAAIEAHGVTFGLGSPAVWRRLADYCAANDVKLRPMKKVFMFGAPVMPDLVCKMKDCLADGEVFTPYGATEALPLTLISGDEILRDTADKTAKGNGVCVGSAIGGAEIRIIEISEKPIAGWTGSLQVAPGQVGEVTVRGAVVTREYLNRPKQTAAAKIGDGEGFWHRMGDLGYLDEKQRLWFCGRKSHRVETAQGVMLPIPCETVFNRHPRVARSALVGIGPPWKQCPVLVVEPRPDARPRSAEDEATFTSELLELARGDERTRRISTVLFHDAFPMDVRHNAKIRREVLAAWAERKLS